MAENFSANRAVISLSGGLDSTCLLLQLLSEGKEVRAYSFAKGVYTEITDEHWNIIREFIKNEKLLCMISTRSNQHKS